MTPSARRRPRQARARATVDRILAAARRVLIDAGADGFNTNRIADAAGVGIGSIYEYFPNKQAIVERLLDDLSAVETDAVLARLAALADADVAAVARGVVETVFDLYVAHGPLYRVLHALSSAERRVGHRPGERAVVAAVERLLAERRGPWREADPALAAFTLFHLVEALCERFARDGLPRWGRERCIDTITAAALAALGAPAPSTQHGGRGHQHSAAGHRPQRDGEDRRKPAHAGAPAGAVQMPGDVEQQRAPPTPHAPTDE